MTHFCWETIWNVLSQLMSFTIVKFFHILFTTVKAFHQRQIPSVTTAVVSSLRDQKMCINSAPTVVTIVPVFSPSSLINSRWVCFIWGLFTEAISFLRAIFVAFQFWGAYHSCCYYITVFCFYLCSVRLTSVFSLRTERY